MKQLPDWWDTENRRRCDLIELSIAGTITAEQSKELKAIDQRMGQVLDQVHPLPSCLAQQRGSAEVSDELPSLEDIHALKPRFESPRVGKMSHAEVLRAIADDEGKITRIGELDAAACIAGAVAIEETVRRRITNDPATWPDHGEWVQVLRPSPTSGKPRFEYAYFLRGNDSIFWDFFHSCRYRPAKVGDIWLPMPSVEAE